MSMNRADFSGSRQDLPWRYPVHIAALRRPQKNGSDSVRLSWPDTVPDLPDDTVFQNCPWHRRQAKCPQRLEWRSTSHNGIQSFIQDPHFLTDLLRAFKTAEINDKLIAADSANRVAFSEQRAHCRSHGGNHLVSPLMSRSIVHFFKMVDIQQTQRRNSIFFLFQRIFHATDKSSSIEQPGQLIHFGLQLQFPLGGVELDNQLLISFRN